MGSWVKLDTPAQKFRVLPPPSLPPPRSCCWSVWWENLRAFNNIFLFLRTDLSHCISLKAVIKISYETMWNHLFLYILHKQYIKITSLFESSFLVDPKNLSTHKCVPTNSQGVSFPLLCFQSGSKNVNKRQYLGIGAFHIQLRVQMNVYLNKHLTSMENTTLI